MNLSMMVNKMFERYIDGFDEHVRVPVLRGMDGLYVSKDGQVIGENGSFKERVVDKNGNICITANMWDGLKPYRLDLLVCLAYGKLKQPSVLFDKIEFFHMDGNADNFHPSNIGYRFIEPIESKTFPGYYLIPFFSRYCISEKGEVIDKIKKKKIGGSVVRFNTKGNHPKNITGGYVQFTLVADTGAMNIGRHRLLVLSFKKYPDIIDKLDVNHKDGIPGNDDLDNLVLATRAENIIHAYQNKLRSQNEFIYGKNVLTGEEKEFYSVNQAGRYIGISPEMISRKLTDEGQRLIRGGWLFKRNKEAPWKEIKNPKKVCEDVDVRSKCLSKNIFTGEIRQHESLSKCGVELGLSNPAIPRQRRKKTPNLPYEGYLFKLASDTTPWPEFTEQQLETFRANGKGRARGIEAFNEEGEVLYFGNASKAMERFSHVFKKPTAVMFAVHSKRVVDGYRFRYA